MLSLILFRHGKSDWDAAFATDHERPLTDRGKEAARAMGRLLRQTGQMPDLAVSSSAMRARETLKLAVQAGRWRCPTRIESALYDNSAADVLKWINALEDTPQCLLLAGHEPTWSDLAGRLVGSAVIRVPTGAMLRIDFDAETWQEVAPGGGELRWLLPPKMLLRMNGGKPRD